jgi:Zn-dependent protease with chaperone function
MTAGVRADGSSPKALIAQPPVGRPRPDGLSEFSGRWKIHATTVGADPSNPGMDTLTTTPGRPASPPPKPPIAISPVAVDAVSVRHLRHRAELPMLVLCSLITAAGVAVAGWLHHTGNLVPDWAAAAVLGLTLPLAAAVGVIRWLYWRQIANSVEVTPATLPDLHAAHVELADAIGLDHLPRLYVRNGHGVINAVAAKCQVRRSYVILSSDVVDIAYSGGDWVTLQFILAHELAHIRCGHVALWRTAITALPSVLHLDRSLRRAQEYTADRCAARHIPDGAAGLLLLYAGKRLYRHIDPGAYMTSVRGHRDGLWLRLVNLASTHPVGFRRMASLSAIDQEGWDVHGRML